MKTKRHFILALILALVLAASVSPAALADDAVVPFKGTYSGIPVGVYDPTCLCLHQTFEFDGYATHLGESHFSSTGTTSIIPPMPQSGSGTFIAANGDELDWSFQGFGQFLPGGLVEFSGDFWFTGGTGRFEGVTGGGTYQGMAHPNTGGQISFDGMLHK